MAGNYPPGALTVLVSSTRLLPSFAGEVANDKSEKIQR
jgi:hypothetical protein